MGESLTGSVNVVLNEIGFLQKVEDAGFVHKHGVGWTAPRARLGNFIAIPLAEFPLPDAIHPYSYNVERDDFDAMLLRHAHELGAKVLQGVNVNEVLFEGDRAVGVRASATDGWTRDLRAPVVVDASRPEVRPWLRSEALSEAPETFKRTRVDALNLSTAESYERPLAAFFKARERRR